jgi:DUF1009 family protein
VAIFRVAWLNKRAGRAQSVRGWSQGIRRCGSLLEEFDAARALGRRNGRLIQLMKKEGCEEMVFAGWLKRPDFSALKLDLKGSSRCPKILAAAKKGDDALLRAVMDVLPRRASVSCRR